MIKYSPISLVPFDLPDAPIAYLNGCITNNYKAVIDFTFQKYTVNQKRLQFAPGVAAGLSTITNINALDTDSFISTYNFLVGETIIVPVSVHNSGTLTITAVSDRVIHTAEILNAEILEVGYIYVNKKITSLDFFYNLIANSEQQISFLSKTDISTLQKYTVAGIDATVGAPVYLQIGTKSFAWVADVVVAPSQSSSYIEGQGMTGYTGITTAYIQSFRITHFFYQTPFFLKEQYNNFATLTPPSAFQDSEMNGQPFSNGLQYVCQVNSKYAAGIAYQDNGVSTRVMGNAAWFDMNNTRTIVEFIPDSITYANASTGDPMDALDIGQDVNVTIKIKSISGLFAVGKFVFLNYFYCPLDASSYQNTTTTLLQNFMFDRSTPGMTIGSLNTPSVNQDTDYQVFHKNNISCPFLDANNLTITAKISYSAYLKNILANKSSVDRNYTFSVCVETTID